MSESDFQSLKDSIKTIGVQMPVVIYESQVIDGWNRFRAASSLGMDCPSIPFDESIDPRDFVKAMNDARRHITGSQRAAAIVAIYKWLPVGISKSKSEPGSYLTQAEMAKEAGVSIKTIQQAQEAQEAGLSERVKSGELTAKQAANVAKGKPANTQKKDKSTSESQSEAPDDDEVRANQLAHDADLAALQMLLDSDDKLAAAHAEIKKLNAEVSQLKVSRDGYMRELDEYKKITTKVQRENDRLRKSH
jgi:hypothetical protein